MLLQLSHCCNIEQLTNHALSNVANTDPMCFSSRDKYLFTILILGRFSFPEICLLFCLLQKRDLVKNALIL